MLVDPASIFVVCLAARGYDRTRCLSKTHHPGLTLHHTNSALGPIRGSHAKSWQMENIDKLHEIEKRTTDPEVAAIVREAIEAIES